MVVIIVCATVVNFGLYYLIDLYYVEENGHIKSIVTVASVIVIVTIIMFITIPRNKEEADKPEVDTTNKLAADKEELEEKDPMDKLNDFVDEDLDEDKKS